MLKLKEILIVSGEVGFRDVITRIQKSGLRFAVVADDDGRLVGTIADGDIRRGIIKGLQDNVPATQVMNDKPKFMRLGQSDSIAKSIMREADIQNLPVVDEDHRVVGLIQLKEFVDSGLSSVPVVIMAGGVGKRLMPLTKKTPKPMLRIAGKPVLQIILEKLIHEGFEHFTICLNYKAEIIKEYFGDGVAWGVNIAYVHEKRMLGTAGALGLIENHPGEGPVLVTNADIITSFDFKGAVQSHINENRTFTTCVKRHHYEVPFGVVSLKDGFVTKLVEKPRYEWLVNVGVYIVDSSIIRQIKGDKFLDMTTVIDEAINDGVNVNVREVEGFWADIGRFEDLKVAEEFLLGC